ncbi:MAG: twin-arginine translocase TatA/TatE family subunit [Chloroflexaceae bacterium]|nr:twin-arginine translocase TatA/TatE family subunit [Chloroflexaceae bacterium]
MVLAFFEILLVLIIGLVILGPERLRDLGRQTGRLMARWLAWQQQSPELQMMQQVRREFEEEIVSLRDELVRAKNQLNAEMRLLDSQVSETTRTVNEAFKQNELADLERLKTEVQTIGQPPALALPPIHQRLHLPRLHLPHPRQP